jgi:hypothetical protein
MYALKSMPSHEEHLLRYERLVFNFSIVGNATPASKQQAVDIPGTVVLRLQGQTAAADAVESGIAWTAAVDNSAGNSVFGILLNLDENIADKVYSVSLTEVSNVSASEAVTGPGGSASFLTAAGNIAIEVAATGLNLASESPTFTVVVEYREAR